MPYMFQTFLSFLYEKNWRFLFYCRKNFVICSKFRAVSLFLSTARIRFYLIRAVEIFLSSSWHFQKKCRAVEIRAVAFRAVDPDSLSCMSKFLRVSISIGWMFNNEPINLLILKSILQIFFWCSSVFVIIKYLIEEH